MSAESFNNKLRRESFSQEDMKVIAEKLNAKYSFKEWFILNDTGEEI